MDIPKAFREYVSEKESTINTNCNVINYDRSEIFLSCDEAILLSESKEGEGYTPDFWVDSEDIEGEVKKWIIAREKFDRN